MPTPAPSASSPASKPAWPARAGRVVALLFLGLLALPLLSVAWHYLATPDPFSAALPARLALSSAILVGPLWLLLELVRRAPRPWLPVSACAASLLVLGVWLTRDDEALRHDPDHPALRSDFPAAASTHALVLRHSKDAPGSIYEQVAAAPLNWPHLTEKPGSAEKWLEFAREHRTEIEARWTADKPLRDWFDELSAQPALADLTLRFSDPSPSFAPLREMTRVASAQATLLALDGQGDEAVRVLTTVLDVGQKLQTHSRTLVRRMVAIVIQRHAITSINLVLRLAPVSATIKARLAETLDKAQDPAEGAVLLLQSEYYVQAREFGAVGSGAISQAVGIANGRPPGLLVRLGYRPRATLNYLGDAYAAGSERIARRDLRELEQISDRLVQFHAIKTPRKNHIGHLLVAMVLPAYSKVAQSHWELQDWRTDLHARLRTP